MAHPVDPHELGRDSLADLRLVTGLAEDRQPGMRVEVDESRTDHEAGGIDGPAGHDIGDVTAEDPHPVLFHGHRTVESRTPGPVDDLATGDQQVGIHVPILPGGSMPGRISATTAAGSWRSRAKSTAPTTLTAAATTSAPPMPIRSARRAPATGATTPAT